MFFISINIHYFVFSSKEPPCQLSIFHPCFRAITSDFANKFNLVFEWTAWYYQANNMQIMLAASSQHCGYRREFLSGFSLFLSWESWAGLGIGYGSWVFPPGNGDDMSIACEESEVCLGHLDWHAVVTQNSWDAAVAVHDLESLYSFTSCSYAEKTVLFKLIKQVRMSNVLGKMEGPSINERGKSTILLYILLAASTPPHH